MIKSKNKDLHFKIEICIFTEYYFNMESQEFENIEILYITYFNKLKIGLNHYLTK